MNRIKIDCVCPSLGVIPSVPASVVLPLVWIFQKLRVGAADGSSELFESRMTGVRCVPYRVPDWEFQTQFFNEL